MPSKHGILYNFDTCLDYGINFNYTIGEALSDGIGGNHISKGGSRRASHTAGTAGPRQEEGRTEYKDGRQIEEDR